MARKFITIHGHFYQPPRENPWLETIEVQDSASPYHDWNERITDECYGPNSAARRVDDAGRLIETLNNYEWLSFNFGPTLLSWLQQHAADVYGAVMRADADSQVRCGGHGNALAQIYNHLIMPLAGHRDQVTQVRWGLADFRHRFRRSAEGMWLSECAVDLDSLQILVDHGIRFVILAPEQAAAVRSLNGHGHWQDMTGGRVDPSRPYVLRLPTGKEIAVFFFDGPISRSLAFGDALSSGKRLAERLKEGFSQRREGDQLVHVAVDGETFGHHNRFGEMSLADGIARLLRDADVVITNYGQFLEQHPPAWEVRLRTPSSWSCPHGVERWRSDCGCHTGSQPDWNQKWRTPLREALNGLKEQLDSVFETSGLFRDPWAARDAYIDVLLDDTTTRRDAFLEAHLVGPAAAGIRVRAWKSLEMQRHAMLMFTSCAWFFADPSGIETQQVLRHAARAIQLAGEAGRAAEEPFRQRLRRAKSNNPDLLDAAGIYEQQVQPETVSLRRVIAHHVIRCSVLRPDQRCTQSALVHHYRIELDEIERQESGESSLTVGSARVVSGRTENEGRFMFAVLHFHGPDLHCAVRAYESPRNALMTRQSLFEAFERRSIAEVVRRMDDQLGVDSFTLRDLFLEQRREILAIVSENVIRGFEQSYRDLYEKHRRLMAFSRELGMPLLIGFRVAAEYVLYRDLLQAFKHTGDQPDFEEFERQAKVARQWGLELDRDVFGQQLKLQLEQAADRLASDPSSPQAVANLNGWLTVAATFDVRLNWWRIHRALAPLLVALRERRSVGVPLAAGQPERLMALAKRLNFRLEP